MSKHTPREWNREEEFRDIMADLELRDASPLVFRDPIIQETYNAGVRRFHELDAQEDLSLEQIVAELNKFWKSGLGSVAFVTGPVLCEKIDKQSNRREPEVAYQVNELGMFFRGFSIKRAEDGRVMLGLTGVRENETSTNMYHFGPSTFIQLANYFSEAHMNAFMNYHMPKMVSDLEMLSWADTSSEVLAELKAISFEEFQGLEEIDVARGVAMMTQKILKICRDKGKARQQVEFEGKVITKDSKLVDEKFSNGKFTLEDIVVLSGDEVGAEKKYKMFVKGQVQLGMNTSPTSMHLDADGIHHPRQ